MLQLLLKSQKLKKTQDATVRTTAAKEVSICCSRGCFPGPGWHFTLKKKRSKKQHWRLFLEEVFSLYSPLGKSLPKQCGASQLTVGRWYDTKRDDQSPLYKCFFCELCMRWMHEINPVDFHLACEVSTTSNGCLNEQTKHRRSNAEGSSKESPIHVWNFTFNQLTTYMVHVKAPVKELPDPLKGKSNQRPKQKQGWLWFYNWR